MHILAWSDSLKLKRFNDGFVSLKHSFSLYKTVTDGLDSSPIIMTFSSAV